MSFPAYQPIRPARPAPVLECPRGHDRGESEALWSCLVCKSTLRLRYDLNVATLTRASVSARNRGMYRFPELLPDRATPDIGGATGNTPLMHARRLGAALGLDAVYLKLDSYNVPSYSYKDRVATTAIQRAVQLGHRAIGCVSTGNVGNAIAALATTCGMRAVVFYPSGLEATKIDITRAYGADIVEVEGTFDDANALCRQLAIDQVLAFANLTFRPYYADGAKTMAFEIVEQLGWIQPRHVVVAAAGAALLTRLAQGFDEIGAAGLADGPVPRLHGAQPEGWDPIVREWKGDRDEPGFPVDTIARSLAIGRPADAGVAAAVIRRSDGTAAALSNREITEGVDLLARREGILTEPAGGAVVAMLKRLCALGLVRPDEVVVLAITGSGLKTPDWSREQGALRRVRNEFDEVRSVVVGLLER